MIDTTVKVGILTDGLPRMQGNEVTNALMGSGFHWRSRYALRLPEEAVVTDASGPLVVEMPLESYLRSVVGSEMNPLSPPEFLRAHAIVSRSWVAGKISGIHREDSLGKKDTPCEIRIWADTAAHTAFHVCSDDHCQRYQGEQPLSDAARQALESTRGLVLTDGDGRIADARFSKCCGGRTELFSTCWQDCDYGYLPSADDEWCSPHILTAEELTQLRRCVLKDYDLASTPRYYRWEEEVTADDISQRLQSRFGRDIGHILSLEATGRGPSGRIHRLLLTGTKGSLYIGKELAIRRLLSDTHLLSSAFEIEPMATPSGMVFRLHGRGWGHGVGMCQTGAAAMALRGYTAEQILNHYFPGTRIISLMR